MRNKLFASAQGGISLSWLIAVLLSFSTMIGVTNMLVAQEKDSMHETRCKIQDNRTSGIVDRASQCDSKSEIQNLSSSSIGDPQLDKAAFAEKTKKLQIPFIANEGQVDKRVKFYANTFGGTVFVTKEGEIVYSLPKSKKSVNGRKSEVRSKKTEGDEKHAKHRIQECRGELHSPSGISHLERGDFVVSAQSNDKGVCNTTPISNDRNETHPRPLLLEGRSGVALKEEFVGAKSRTIQGEDPSVTKVNYFKGNNPEKWKNNISTYDFVNLGEIYKGIELKLKAYGDNVEKLFCVKPGADPKQIRISLSGMQPPESPLEKGTRRLSVNDEGQLVAETELGPVKFTKPVAYQEINGKRVDVSVEYRVESSEAENKSSKRKTCNSKLMSTNPKSKIQNLSSTSTGDPQSEYGFKVASYDRTKDLVIDPLLASTYVGGSNYDRALSIAIDTSSNVYVGGSTISSNFPTTTGVYDTSFNGGASDAFLLKFDADLNNLLASTYLGGTKDDYIYSIVIGTGGNIYMCGDTGSSDFPTTTGAYDTSINNGSNYYDGFVSKLDSGLTSLLASTYLGGSDSDHPRSITKDSGGNIYVNGMTYSSDFPVTTGVYDSSFNGGVFDSFISKFNGTLATLLASTYLGGSGNEYSQYHGPSLAIDTSGNILVTGTTYSSDFPTTTGVYDTSLGGDRDAFVSKISGDLTNLLASTYLGGSIYDEGYSIAGDSSGNIYVVGYTYSSDFPTTTGAYDTSYNSGNDAFVSKFNGSLTGLLASTYLGGSNSDEANALVIDYSGNIYIAGYTDSSEFPTTASAYDTSRGGATDAFISEFNGALTSLLASTYLGGSGIGDVCYSLAIDSGGNIYATGYTKSSDFPTTTGAYDISYNDNSGSYDVFVSKLDSNLSASSKPTVTTSSATNVTSSSATLNGTVNANGQSTTAWFNYGITSGSYTGTSTTQSVSGSSNTTVSIGISGLLPSTTYYYRIAASNSEDTAYGSEASFITRPTPTPTPTPSPTPTPDDKPLGSVSINSDALYTNSTVVTLTLTATDDVGVIGYYASTSSSIPTASASGWNSVTSTTIYSGSVSYTLASGDENKTVNVWYKDAARNLSNTASDSIILDTTSPIVTITSPTSGDTHATTSSPLSLSGSASDISSGVKEVTWANSKGGSGAASGTTSWTVSSISLSSGDNIINVTATDNAGNTGKDIITVRVTPPTPEPSPTPTTTPKPSPIPTPTITQKGIIVGIVADSVSGVGIAEAKITADKGGYFATTGVDGTYTIADVSNGNYTLTASAEGYASSSQPVTVYAGEVTVVDFLLTRESKGIIFGIVQDEEENPLRGVSVIIEGNNFSDNTETNEDGFFTFENVLSGNYTLTFEKEGYETQTMDTTLGEGEVKDLGIITLEQVETGKVYGYVVNIKGNPLEFVRLRLKGIKTKVIKTASSDADGFFEYTDLKADTYVIFAKKKGYKKTQKKVVLEEGESTEIEIEMKRTSKRIKGLIQEEDVQ